ncbi:response regulator [Clostridium sp. SM-530-WT-3G]|uniref:response regulator n=1 Tax=Clostridium sp. SM-530-WT-3G TaxID=2725303 RepID=UPI00145F2C96|nr:response regulator [Clostridium sp. SM-530-WT-3G]NME84007.1 response regulator [Clostridium sp. SM-530-WT-3G]
MITVLIVEDDPMVGFINKQYLNNIGDIRVLGPVYEEDEVISLLENEKIDLILLDVFLPKKSGIELLKEIRSRKFLVDVIIISAANNTEDLKQAFAYGIIDYLIKPFQFERFEEAISKYKFRQNLFSKDIALNQNDVDKICAGNSDQNANLPKGLNKLTLDKLIEFLSNNSDQVWTLREISNEINISNVTVKKYMDYLESINKVYVETTFGNVGRPELKYKLI